MQKLVMYENVHHLCVILSASGAAGSRNTELKLTLIFHPAFGYCSYVVLLLLFNSIIVTVNGMVTVCFLIGNSTIPRAARVQLFSWGILMRIFWLTSGAFNAPEPGLSEAAAGNSGVTPSAPCPVTSRSDVALVAALALKSRPNLFKRCPQTL